MSLAGSERAHLCVHGLTENDEQDALRHLLSATGSSQLTDISDEVVVKGAAKRKNQAATQCANSSESIKDKKTQRSSEVQQQKPDGGTVGRVKKSSDVPVKRTASKVVPVPKEVEAESVAFQADSVSHEAESLPPIAELVHKKLIRPLTEVLCINSLTRIQKLSWMPMVDKTRDVLVRSETGSGKTLAYALPLLHQLLCDCDTRPLKRDVGSVIIVLCPVRELVVQVSDVLTILTRCALFLTVGGIHGGENRHKEKARLRKGITILATTPGRLLDHLKATSSFRVEELQTIVLDEADRLLDMGFEKTIREVMDLLVAKKRDAHQTGGGDAQSSFKRVLVSATITAAVERLSHFALRDNIVRVGETEDTFSIPSSLRQHYVLVPTKHRLATLISFLRSQLDAGAQRLIVFVSTADSAEFHYYLLSRLKSPFRGKTNSGRSAGAPQKNSNRYSLKKRIGEANRHIHEGRDEDVVTFDDDSDDEDPTEVNELSEKNAVLDVNIFKLHGNMSQVDRASVFHAFKHMDSSVQPSKKGILFCTDVAARGLDMPNVDWIVHYDPPTDAPCYIHRIGRTARIGNTGDSMLFLMPHEEGYASYLSNFLAKETKLGSMAKGANAESGIIEERKYESFLFYLTKLDPKANHMWAQSTATLERAICRLVMKRHSNEENVNDESTGRTDDITRLALFAYQSYIRAYAGHSRELKRLFFNSDALHLGHVAQNFGIDKRPSEVRSQLQGLIKEDRKVARETTSVVLDDGSERPRKVLRTEVPHDDRYRSTVVQKQRKVTRDWYENKKKLEGPTYKHQQFTEFDA
ncbi:ATP-dependent DEAD/H RNA helicase, putative [Trypanosoma equiperdum]|uniref:ATP-dependent RNA helicase n=1 Tax=Trypanosoma equiperdum TaxID=5694 RepID=A0A1G4I8Z7_TRYEQ|nr:ATP-dependent DEAD/H RNA helicase, putative [Trypanosoma equiperdum]